MGVVLMIVATIIAYRLRAWCLARLITYVKTRYPDEWHQPANLTRIFWVGVLLVVGTFVTLFAAQEWRVLGRFLAASACRR